MVFIVTFLIGVLMVDTMSTAPRRIRIRDASLGGETHRFRGRQYPRTMGVVGDADDASFGQLDANERLRHPATGSGLEHDDSRFAVYFANRDAPGSSETLVSAEVWRNRST